MIIFLLAAFVVGGMLVFDECITQAEAARIMRLARLHAIRNRIEYEQVWHDAEADDAAWGWPR